MGKVDEGSYERFDSEQRAASRARPTRQQLLLLVGGLLLVGTFGFAALVPWQPSPPPSGRLTPFQLSTWPTTVADGSDLVVSWRGGDALTEKDYITLSCGPQNGPSDYLRRRNVSDTDAAPNSVRFSDLFMMRCDYSVEYFQHDAGAPESFKSLGKISVSTREPFEAPKHGHLALTSEPNAMAVMFNSASYRTPEAKYGRHPDQLDRHSTGTSTTYAASDMCQAPANVTAQRRFRDPGFMHTVVMTDLEPDTYYSYQYGNDKDGWSKIATFRSKPTEKTSKKAKFIAYGDMGVDPAPAATSTAMRVYADVVGNGFDSFLLHFGDISYARGDGSVWDKFFHLIEPFATRIPYMVSVGNHEQGYTRGGEKDPSGEPAGGFRPHWGNYGEDSKGECSVPMVHRWHVPATGNSLFWYSFDYAGIHVIQLSSEHNWTRGSRQHDWLAKDLAAVNRTETPWIIVTAHRMMYSTQVGLDRDRRVADHFREEVEELLFTYKVNLVLVGHQHSYERSCPVYQGECVADGKSAPVHMIVGSAGFQLGTEGFSNKYGNWSVAHADEYGHIRVTSTEVAMHIEFVLNRNGDVLDEVTLTPYHQT